MTNETRMQLRHQLEEITHSNEGAYSKRLFLLWSGLEILFGVWILGGAISLIAGATPNRDQATFWFGCMCILCALILFGHVARIVMNRFMNRKLRLLFEALLQTTEAQ